MYYGGSWTKPNELTLLVWAYLKLYVPAYASGRSKRLFDQPFLFRFSETLSYSSTLVREKLRTIFGIWCFS
jgi:hypothetical protein